MSVVKASKVCFLVGIGILLGALLFCLAKAGVEATSSDKFCDQSCHAHPDATQTWIRSPHYTNKSGVVMHCIDCHLPGGEVDYYTEKARLGAQDIYGKLFKDLTKINWQSLQTLTQARTSPTTARAFAATPTCSAWDSQRRAWTATCTTSAPRTRCAASTAICTPATIVARKLRKSRTRLWLGAGTRKRVSRQAPRDFKATANRFRARR